MRIGLFTDSYLHTGSTNGIMYVVETMRQSLSELGHEVYVVAPKTGIARPKFEENILWIPALQGIFFNEQLTSIFFPPLQLRTIAKLELDVIIIFTPGQIGLLGANSAVQQNIPLVSQYCTDLSEYIERYPTAIIGAVALGMTSPFVLKLSTREMAAAMRSFVTKDQDVGFRQHIVEKLLAALHSRCAALIAVSDKTAQDLARWNPDAHIVTIPTGVDALPLHTEEAKSFREHHTIPEDAKVLLYVGRLAKEKNLELLIDAFDGVAMQEPDVYLALVGNFAYRKQLEQRAAGSIFADRIIFTGAYPREQLGAIYEAGDIFLFPSITDTQALVINEAAHASLPFVWVDNGLNQVLIDGKTGLHADNTPEDFADKIQELLHDDKRRTQYGTESCKQAQKLQARPQAKKVVKLLKSL